MGKPQYIQISIRLLLLIANVIVIFYSFQNAYILNTIGFLLLLIFQIYLFIDYINSLLADVEKSMDCLLYEDYSNTISAKKRKNPLHNKTALLLEKHRKLSLQNTSEQLIFTNIIESLAIGILILRRDKSETIEVFQINNAFIDFLKIPKYYKWNLLKEKIGTLSSLILKWEKLRHVISLNVNNQSESFFLKTSITQTNDYEYFIVSLETIQQLIDKKEKESWYKLMNVMSHEIINTITPISSLAENLDSLLQDEPDKDTLNELSKGLKIIKKRSYHLTSFVDTYRKLAELPLPKKAEIGLTEIVNNTLTLFEQEFSSKNIIVNFESSKNCAINADKQQVEQVIINLLSNCLYALEQTKNPTIHLEITQENNRTLLAISDNGIGISDDIKDNIFVPYFTTRKNGSGIGLALTKSIMESHGGTVFFQLENHLTTFILNFIT